MLSKIGKKRRAASDKTTLKNIQQNGSYRNSIHSSSAKLQLGTLLLHLQTPLSKKQKQGYWHQFNSMLRQYMDLKVCMEHHHD